MEFLAGVATGLAVALAIAFTRRRRKKSSQLTVEGGELMFKVKADHADEPFEVAPVVMRDSEGHRIPGETTVVVESDNPGAVEVIPDPGGNPRKGSVHFGAPNEDGSPALATTKATHTDQDGKVVAIKASTFLVTVGDPSTVEGGEMTFPGLTAEPE